MKAPTIDVIIPAFNECSAIQHVIRDIPKDLIRNIIVVDNNSSDCTAQKAKEAGAIVLHESFQGYGASCLTGIAYSTTCNPEPDIIVFLDGDYSDHPQEMTQIVQPIIQDNKDLVIGSRNNAKRESGSMTIQQVFGNWLATYLIKIFFQHTYTDLGPFRAIRTSALHQIQMQDKTYGWTVEMQIKALKHNLNVTECPVSYRNRIGKSKISGTIKGTLLAGQKIISTIFKYR